MEKCNLCVHKVAYGGVPACVENCPSDAMFFGTMLELSNMMRKRYSSKSLANGAQVYNPSVGPGAGNGKKEVSRSTSINFHTRDKVRG
jgi:Fe-S-cluster-containing dehydrogenase component